MDIVKTRMSPGRLFARRSARSRRVTFEPLHRAGVDFLPVVGRSGRPSGAFVVDDHSARWEPAFNLNAAVFWGNISFIALLAVGGLVIWRRSRTRREAAARATGDRAEVDRSLPVAVA